MLKQDLVGKTLLSVSVKADGVHLTTDSGNFRIYAEGDCCSSGWIGAVQIPDLPAKITKADSYPTLEGSVETLLTDIPQVPSRYGKEGEMRPCINDGVCPRKYAADKEAGDTVVQYLFEIQTECGPLKMDIWNDSNGYYGSSVELEIQ